MLNSFDVRRGPRTWWVGFLSLVVCLCADSGGLRAQERLAASPVIQNEAGEFLALIIHAQDPMKQCHLADAKVDYLIEELVTQRLENARLSIELAAAKADGAQTKEASRQQEALLTALMAAVATRERRDATARSEAADMRQRLAAAQAELRRQVSKNDRLAAELAAVHKAADSATMMAQDNLAVINAQIGVLHATVGSAALDRAKQPRHVAQQVPGRASLAEWSISRPSLSSEAFQLPHVLGAARNRPRD
jgi:hypothetical protein